MLWELNLSRLSQWSIEAQFLLLHLHHHFLPDPTFIKLPTTMANKLIDYRMSKSTLMRLLALLVSLTYILVSCYNNESLPPNPFSLSFYLPFQKITRKFVRISPHQTSITDGWMIDLKDWLECNRQDRRTGLLISKFHCVICSLLTLAYSSQFCDTLYNRYWGVQPKTESLNTLLIASMVHSFLSSPDVIECFLWRNSYDKIWRHLHRFYSSLAYSNFKLLPQVIAFHRGLLSIQNRI